MTENGGTTWAQTIYYPFMYTSMNGRGNAIKTTCECSTYDAGNKKNVPLVDSSAVLSEDGNKLSLFVFNRSMDETCELDIDAWGFEDYKLCEHISLEGDDLKAINTKDEPNKVIPVFKEIGDVITLAPHSWSMLVFEK